ncbi:Adenylyl-sulfate kinase [Candidatus Magnetomoraceae bacterium gMMP-15]
MKMNYKTNQKFILWLLGLTSSGKTTIGRYLVDELRNNDIPIIHYDGDEVRDFFGNDFGFSGKNRLRVVKTIVHLANKAAEAGLNVVVSALTANTDARDYVQANVNNLITGHIKCSVNTCMSRDPKGLYEKAKKGEIKTLIGYNNLYVPPDSPNIIIDTDEGNVNQCAFKLITYLKDNNLI